MILRREILIRELRILAIFMGASLIQTFLMCRGCTTLRTYGIIYLFTVLMWLVLWRGNNALTHFISSKISWIRYPVTRFFIGLGGTVLFTLASVIVLLAFIEGVFNFQFGDSYSFTVYFAIFFTLIISVFLHSREFLSHWRKAALEAEKFNRERLSAKYENLKSRVNPQLLFNSLATLRQLAVNDKDNAAKFIKRLSDVYRYILDTRDKEVVPSQQEVKFLHSFIFLLQTRFGNAIRFNLTFSEKPFFISPLSIQLVIEAVVENSNVDDTNQLEFNIIEDGNYVTIEANNKWAENHSADFFTTVIESIVDRYKFLTDNAVKYTINENGFMVILPCIR